MTPCMRRFDWFRRRACGQQARGVMRSTSARHTGIRAPVHSPVHPIADQTVPRDLPPRPFVEGYTILQPVLVPRSVRYAE